MDELLFSTCMPLVCLAVTGIIMTIQKYHLKQTIKKAYNENTISSNLDTKIKKMDQEVTLLYLNFVLIVSFTILPSVTTTIFTMFLCENVDQNNENSDLPSYYLVADSSIECGSDRFNFGRTIAIIMLFVYPIGIPANYFSTLYTYHIAIINRDADKSKLSTRLRGLSFLYIYYKPEFWYFEVIETVRRLTLTAVLSVTLPDSGFQIVFAIVLSLIFKEIYAKLDPFKDPKLSITAELGSIQIFFTFFAVLVIEKSLLGTFCLLMSPLRKPSLHRHIGTALSKLFFHSSSYDSNN